MRLVVCAGVFAAIRICAAAPPGISSEFILAPQDKHVHSSSVVECPNGDLLACWFYGSGERSAKDVLIQGARLKRGSKAWSAVFEMADTPEHPDCNPVLFIDANERLWLFWIVVQSARWEESLLKYRRAEQYQHAGPPRWSWQDVILLQPGDEFAEAMKAGFERLDPPEPMWAEYAPPYSRQLIEAARDPEKRQAGWMTRTRPVALPSGRILLPLYSDGFNVGLIGISDDHGATWRPSLPIVGLGPIQPAIARKRNGELIAFLRDSGGAPNRVLRAASGDDGVTWTLATDTDIPNPGSSLAVASLKDGRWLMICNDTELGRHRIVAMLSDDEGTTWRWKRTLDEAEPRAGSFAYPCAIQTRDSRIHVTYTYNRDEGKTIKHVAFEADWVATGHLPAFVTGQT
jgi:predicted neuraminidase